MTAMLEKLSAMVGDTNVVTDVPECEFFAQDVYSAGPGAAAVVKPGDKVELAEVVRVATEAGVVATWSLDTIVISGPTGRDR